MSKEDCVSESFMQKNLEICDVDVITTTIFLLLTCKDFFTEVVFDIFCFQAKMC